MLGRLRVPRTRATCPVYLSDRRRSREYVEAAGDLLEGRRAHCPEPFDQPPVRHRADHLDQGEGPPLESALGRLDRDMEALAAVGAREGNDDGEVGRLCFVQLIA